MSPRDIGLAIVRRAPWAEALGRKLYRHLPAAPSEPMAAQDRSLTAIGNLARFISRHPLTRDEPLKAWARFAAWQIKCRIQAEVIVLWISGQRLAVRRGMTGATGNVYAGLHEFVDMMMVLHLLREDDLFLDVGANVGSYTVLASGVRRARTLAFEPDPGTVCRLKRNIDINALEAIVTVHAIALGESDGETTFTAGLDTMNRLADAGAGEVRNVVLRRLDTVIGDQAPIMMKLDVEGSEEAVLRGARKLIAKKCLKVIALETVTPEIEAALGAGGFARAIYDPFNRVLRRGESNPAAANALFVNDWAFVAARLAAGPRVNVLGRDI